MSSDNAQSQKSCNCTNKVLTLVQQNWVVIMGWWPATMNTWLWANNVWMAHNTVTFHVHLIYM